ncbi:MAG TPA: cytochrome P450 [Thermoanaerobaculia bacterium]|nr:cytochrome P450 [Thermoanaerobaculia bacterium]
MPIPQVDPSSRSAALPPGRSGLPWLGETGAFLADGFGFCAARVARHGPVFRTRILGRETAVISGPEATAAFNDEERVLRSNAMVPHVAELMGMNCLPLLDGTEHRRRKEFVLAGFTPEAHAAYLPEIESEVARALAEWAEEPEIRGVEEMKKLALQAICTSVLGIPAGPVQAALRAEYALVLAGFSAFPVPLPGTAYSKAKAALDKILDILEAAIHDHLERPREDGLSRILSARAEDGGAIGVEELKVELHHVVVAGLIVWAELAAMVLAFEKHPEMRERLRSEIATLPDGPLTADSLRRLPYLSQVILETKRICPIVPVFFGRARRAFDLSGQRIPEGWMVLWSHRTSLLEPEIYPQPERFDPDRFAPDRAEHRRHPFGYAPQGAGPATGHRCPGIDFSTLLMSAFAIELARNYDVEIPADQDLRVDWSKIPPEPKGGLRLRIRRRAKGSAG